MSGTKGDPEVLRRLDQAMREYPTLSDRIARAVLIELHNSAHATVDEVFQRTRAGSGDPSVHEENQPTARRLDVEEREAVWRVTQEIAAQKLTPEKIDEIVLLTRKREEAQSLEEIASLPAVSFGLLRDRVKKFCELPVGQATLSPKESRAARVALIRQLISDHLEFIGVAKEYVTIRHFDDLVDRIIGSASGVGRIGGKAAGMLLAKAILDAEIARGDDAPGIEVAIPESYYVRADVLDELLRSQGMWDLHDQKYRTMTEVRHDYPLVLNMLKNADFPAEITEQFRRLLEQLGEHPLIVRSSSLLEDRFGTAFAGKYRSLFLPNQGPLESRVHELLGAVAEVYASTLHPDPISYRIKRRLIDYDESMAVLIQKVVGQRIGPYYLPLWAGVGLSLNEHRRAPRVRPEDGMARLVLGLGTRAVDRVGGDCPRLMALALPALRPEVRPEDIAHYSQHRVDVINLEENRLQTVDLATLLAEGTPPGLENVLSILHDQIIRRPSGKMIIADPQELVVTFDRFAQESPYPALLQWVLKTLERAYGCPVDIEFAFDGERFYLLQCRPQAVRPAKSAVRIPAHVPPDDRLFSARQDLQTDSAGAIEYIVLIDPLDYDTLHSEKSRQEVARAVREVNEKLEDRSFVLMGPGRWGSKDSRMGVRVGYADINHARALVEIVRRRGGHVAEVSFGSHFFQDLVESDILYLPLYPDDEGNLFNEAFLHGSPNVLLDLVPHARGVENVVRVIDVLAASGGKLLHIDIDGERQEALGYLAPV